MAQSPNTLFPHFSPDILVSGVAVPVLLTPVATKFHQNFTMWFRIGPYGNAAWIITISRLDEQGKTLPSGVTSLRFSLPPPITGELRLSTFAELLPRCRGATNFPATPIHSQEQQNKSVFVFSGLLRMQL